MSFLLALFLDLSGPEGSECKETDVGFLLALFLALPALLQTDGLRVEPTWGIASHYAMWTVTYEVGPGGLRAGGALRVQLPDTWHAGLRRGRGG